MASSGPNSGGTITNNSAVGTNVWSVPGNAATSNNGYTQAVSIGGVQVSNYLDVRNLGFSIPSGATIDGIVVEIEKKATYPGGAPDYVKDNIIKLVKGGTVVGSNLADTATRWGTSDSYISYGSSSNLWGTTWTDSDINGSSFGVVISASNNTTSKINCNAFIDHVRITIYYTTGGGPTPANPLLLIGN